MDRPHDRRLILLRHAKSSWDHPELSDFDRPLNQRGRRNAPEMGLRLQARGLLPDLIVSSPAVRALETAGLAGEVLYGKPPRLRLVDRLYLASPQDLLQAIHGLDDRCRCVMLVAHNPGLTDLINELAPLRLTNLPTCGYADFIFEAESWGLAEPECARLIALDYPKNPNPPH